LDKEVSYKFNFFLLINFSFFNSCVPMLNYGLKNWQGTNCSSIDQKAKKGKEEVNGSAKTFTELQSIHLQWRRKGPSNWMKLLQKIQLFVLFSIEVYHYSAHGERGEREGKYISENLYKKLHSGGFQCQARIKKTLKSTRTLLTSHILN